MTKTKTMSAQRRAADKAPALASIHALFIALRALGWRSGLEHAHGWLRPAPDAVPVDADTPLPTAEQVDAVFMAAHQLGWVQLSHEEIGFLHNMYCLAQEGRDHFEAVAAAIQMNHPWRPSLAESCVGAYKVPHYSTGEQQPVSLATPREQALFAVIRQAGIRVDQNRGNAQLRPRPLPPCAPLPKLNDSMRRAANALGAELGWSPISTAFASLINLLRTCDDKGQQILHTTLSALLRRHRQ